MNNSKLSMFCIIGSVSLFCMFSPLKAETDYLDKIKFKPIAKEHVDETLTLLSAAIQGNYEQIRTWQADIDAYTEMVHSSSYIESVFRDIIKYKGTPPQNTLSRSNRKISIMIDTQSEYVYERSVRQGPMRYFDAKDNNEIAAVTGPFEKAYIVTPTYYIDCLGNKKKDDAITGYRAIKKPVRHQRETMMKYDIFDPRLMIYMAEPVWNYLDMWRRKLQENNGDWKIGPHSGKFEEGRDGNDIVYHLLLPAKVTENEYVFLSLFFAEKAGWNMVKLETLMQDLKVLGRMQAEYCVVDGIYIPKRITAYNFNEDQSVSRIEDYIFAKQSLNKDIAKNTFTYENLGLKNGDIFEDKIEGKEYKYKDAKLVEIEKKAEKNNDAEKKSEVEQKEQITSGDTKSTAVTGN